jgi:dephospho-CoA kinase
MSQEEKESRGRWIIRNNGTKEELREEICRFIKKIN